MLGASSQCGPSRDRRGGSGKRLAELGVRRESAQQERLDVADPCFADMSGCGPDPRTNPRSARPNRGRPCPPSPDLPQAWPPKTDKGTLLNKRELGTEGPERGSKGRLRKWRADKRPGPHGTTRRSLGNDGPPYTQSAGSARTSGSALSSDVGGTNVRPNPRSEADSGQHFAPPLPSDFGARAGDTDVVKTGRQPERLPCAPSAAHPQHPLRPSLCRKPSGIPNATRQRSEPTPETRTPTIRNQHCPKSHQALVTHGHASANFVGRRMSNTRPAQGNKSKIAPRSSVRVNVRCCLK